MSNCRTPLCAVLPSPTGCSLQPKPANTPTPPRPQGQPSPSIVVQQPPAVYGQTVCFPQMYPLTPVSPGVQVRLAADRPLLASPHLTSPHPLTLAVHKRTSPATIAANSSENLRRFARFRTVLVSRSGRSHQLSAAILDYLFSRFTVATCAGTGANHFGLSLMCFWLGLNSGSARAFLTDVRRICFYQRPWEPGSNSTLSRSEFEVLLLQLFFFF